MCAREFRTALRGRSAAHPFLRRRRRGSTILLVISILSLLALLVIAMTFTSRLEQTTAQNFGIGVQNRVAAITGVDAVSADLAASLPAGPISTLDLSLEPGWYRLRPGGDSVGYYARAMATASFDDEDASFREAEAQWELDNKTALDLLPREQTGTADVVLQDASARININAASPEVLAGFFNAAGNELGVSLNGGAIARAIAEVRYGMDGAPGRANVDDDMDARDALDIEDASRKFLVAPTGPQERPDARELGRRVDEIRPQPGIDDPAGEAERRATRLTLMTGIDEPDEYIADVRRPAFGDDIRFGSISDLLLFPQIRSAGLNEQVLTVLEPWMTTFSTSQKELVAGGEIRDLLDLNRAGVTEIAEALEAVYGGTDKNKSMLRQFAVNIVDARDFDSIPTQLSGSGDMPILGVERTPFIVEVYHDSVTPEERGDDGQFVELHNPWPEPMDVEGWRLDAGGTSVRLTGRIEPYGFLIVTDDIDNRRDDHREDIPGTGSFYDIFDILPSDRGPRRALASPGFDIPNTGQPVRVTLYNNTSDLIDYFTFTPRLEEFDGLYSWQRDNPLVRAAFKRPVTPFSLPRRIREADSETLARLVASPQDGPFVSVADVLGVFAGFRDIESDDDGEGVQWGFPVIGTPAGPDNRTAELARHPNTIDARVLDIFTVEYREYREEAEPGEKSADPRDMERLPLPITISAAEQTTGRDDQADLQALAAQTLTPARPGLHHGRININTAGQVVLAALPGVGTAEAAAILERRHERFDAVARGALDDGVLYRGLSDVLVDPLLTGRGQSGLDRLRRFRALEPHIALNSRAFVLTAQPRGAGGADGDLRRASRIEALVGIDRGVPETIAWRNVRDSRAGN